VTLDAGETAVLVLGNGATGTRILGYRAVAVTP
jgi:hypothetical protein